MVMAYVLEAINKIVERQAAARPKPHDAVYHMRQRWHDPPNLLYDKYEIYSEIQKKLKDAGGSLLPLFTLCVDAESELRLIEDYKRWTEAQSEQALATDQLLDNGPSTEAVFYQNLAHDCLAGECAEAAVNVSRSGDLPALLKLFEEAEVTSQE